jgi:hypothetical protein
VILVVLWLLGFFGRNISPSFPQTGGWIHTLLADKEVANVACACGLGYLFTSAGSGGCFASALDAEGQDFKVFVGMRLWQTFCLFQYIHS